MGGSENSAVFSSISFSFAFCALNFSLTGNSVRSIFSSFFLPIEGDGVKGGEEGGEGEVKEGREGREESELEKE